VTSLAPGFRALTGPREVSDELEAAASYGLRRVFARFRRKKLAVAAVVVVLVGILLAIIGPFIAPSGLEQTFPSYTAPPSLAHLLGTDSIGHDELSQLLFAMRSSIFAAGFAAILGAVGGTIVGVVSGYAGGWVDWVIGRCIDALLSFPGLLLIIALIGVFGAGLYPAMIALGISFVGGFARLVRGEVLSARQRDFVAAAKVTGVPSRRIILRHIIPTILPSFIVQLCLTFGFALIAQGALGFLGLGSQPPQTSLGAMMQSGFQEINTTIRLVLIPGIAITVMATAFNVIADGLRDSLGRDVGELAGPRA
jgi:ABC-type dipeptide/oligopeptide/nickel transport system permease subunit